MSQKTIEQHKQVIIDALNVAVKAGCFTIHDCSQIIESLNAVLQLQDTDVNEEE
jgi:hypothetical protein